MPSTSLDLNPGSIEGASVLASVKAAQGRAAARCFAALTQAAREGTRTASGRRACSDYGSRPPGRSNRGRFKMAAFQLLGQPFGDLAAPSDGLLSEGANG